MLFALHFLNSTDVFEYEDGNLIPIVIISAKGWKYEENDDLFSFDFEYERNVLAPIKLPRTEEEQ